MLSLIPGLPPDLWRYSRATLRRLRTKAQDSGTAVDAWTNNIDFTVPALHCPAQWLYLRRGCPLYASIKSEIEATLRRALPGLQGVTVELVRAPP